MSEPLIQQLIHPEYDSVEAFIAGWGSLGPIFVKLCAHLDEQAADKPDWHKVGDGAFASPFGTIRVCECGCLVAGGPSRCTRCANGKPEPAASEDTPHFDTCRCEKCQPPTALAELRTIAGATGANEGRSHDAIMSEARLKVITRLGAELDEARAALARVTGEYNEMVHQRDDANVGTIMAETQLAKVTAERDESLRVERIARGVLVRMNAERDTLTAQVAEAERELADINLSWERTTLTLDHKSSQLADEQSAHEVTKRKLVETQQDAIAISGHLSRARAALEAVGKLVASADIPLPLFNEFEAALSALDKPAAAVCLGCRKPFASPDHDPLCSSCRESDTGERFPLHPAAAVAEPREIRVGSRWRNKLYGHMRTVAAVRQALVSWIDDGGYGDHWRLEVFLEAHEWVSDPTAETKEM